MPQSRSAMRAESVDLESFFTAALNAVERANTTRARLAREAGVDIEDFIGNGTTVGIWDGPRPTWPDGNEPVPMGRRDSLGTRELRDLRMKERLTGDSLAQLSRRISGDTQTALKFVNSLSDDFAGTLDYLFELNEDEQEYLDSLERSARNGFGVPADGLNAMVRSGAEISEVEIDVVQDPILVAAKKKEEKKEENPFKFTIEGGVSEGGGWEVKAKFEWSF